MDPFIVQTGHERMKKAVSKSNTVCCVPGCNSVAKKSPHLSFHNFPTRSYMVQIKTESDEPGLMDKRAIWESNVRLGRPVTKSMRVCSLHFNESDYIPNQSSGRKDLRRNAFPTQNLPSELTPRKQATRPGRSKPLLGVLSPSQINRFYSDVYTKTNFSNGIKTVTMSNPKTRNSLSISMMESLLKDLTQDADNVELRAIVIAGEGPVFSAGHNLKELTDEVTRAEHVKVFAVSTRLMHTIIDCPVPIIARVDGLAAAAGCQLVAQCDLAVCSTESTFSTPGANFGIFCSTPGVALARSMPKAKALKMLLTGNAISSEEAKQYGLVTEVCSRDQLDQEIDNMCTAIKKKSRSVIQLGKKFYYEQVNLDVKQAYEKGSVVMVNNINSEDGKEGIRSFVQKRQPQWSHNN